MLRQFLWHPIRNTIDPPDTHDGRFHWRYVGINGLNGTYHVKMVFGADGDNLDQLVNTQTNQGMTIPLHNAFQYCWINFSYSLGCFSRWQTNNIFLSFPRKQDLAFHANCLQWRQFAWTAKSCFLGKNKKNISVCHLLKILPRVLSVKWQGLDWDIQICRLIRVSAHAQKISILMGKPI